MKIDILCRDGSPLGVTLQSIYGEDGRVGVGGAELALLTMCEEWAKAGHDITLYNNPLRTVRYLFDQRNINYFDPKEKRDVLIIFRSPNPLAFQANGLKVWWSTDQYTIDNFRSFAPHMDRIVCISPFHQEYFRRTYGINDTVSIDLPVRVRDYVPFIERIPYRLLYSSVPDRGLAVLHSMWPLIKRDIPEASLVITSDYRLWGLPSSNNERYRMMFILQPDVFFKGAIRRHELVVEQLRADVLAYPCTYDELFCYSVAEAQVAGAYPITTTTGALSTTNMGLQIPGNCMSPEWVDRYVDQLKNFVYSNPIEKEARRKKLQEVAIERFSPKRILKEWDEKVFKKG